MKSQLMKHQERALAENKPALFAEQGTGKTVIFLALAERYYRAAQIEALFVVAPKGVHTNWVKREIPRHLSAQHKAVAYRRGHKATEQAMQALYAPVERLRVLTMSIDSVVTPKGRAAAERFLRAFRTMMVVDESSRIKNPRAKRTLAVWRLGGHAAYRYIGSGLPLTNAPLDLWAQFEFLRPGMLGINSHRAFVAAFAELLPGTHHLVRHISARSRGGTPQIVARDDAGRPRWKNLERLKGLIEPHCFRVLKRDCLDLPEKIYTTRYFDLLPRQRAVYGLMEREHSVWLDAALTAVEENSVTIKCQQITSGFVLAENEAWTLDVERNPRLDLLVDAVQDVDGKFIVWARFREELRAIAERLTREGIELVQYHGGVSAAQRELAVDAFQAGAARAFVAQPQSGGIGLTLTAASTVIYYSNDFNLETRLQSEDRAHRIGTRNAVVYVDLVASDTIDESIVAALQHKQRLSRAVLGDE